MQEETITLRYSRAPGFVIPLGPVNLVFVVARKGMVGCGAFDVAALGNFGYPAARVRPVHHDAIRTLDDLLAGEVKEANPAAGELGVVPGMSGRDALDILS